MKRYLPLALVMAAVGTTAVAQDDKTWGIALELGATSTSGNTDTLSIQSKADVRHETQRWQNQYLASILFKEDEITADDGSRRTEKTAERYFASAKSGYKLDQQHTNVFAFASHTEDEFGSFERYTTASLGYGARWLDEPAMFLDVELGPGYFRGERSLADDTVEIENGAMIRGAGEFQWDFSDTASFAQSVSVEAGSDNTRTISDTSVSTKMSDRLQMKVGLSIYHDTNVAPDKDATDTTTFINLVYDL